MNHLRRSLPLILIALVLLLSGAKNATPLEQSRDQSHEAKTQQQTDATQQQQAISPAFAAAILETLRAEVAQEVAKREQDHADHNDWNTKPFRLTFGLNLALVVVGGAYTWVAYWQLAAIKRQADLTDGILKETQKASETAQRQAKAAEDQVINLQASLIATQATARAAEKSAEVSEKALFTAARPHLIIHDFALDGFKNRIEGEERSLAAIPEIQRLTMPRSLRLTYKVRNYGKSPAFLTIAIIRFRIADRVPIPYEFGQRPAPQRGWILPPDENRTGERFLESGQLSENDRLLVVTGQKHLVAYGMLEYADIFGNFHLFGFACRYVVGGGSDPGNRFEPTGSEEFWIYR